MSSSSSSEPTPSREPGGPTSSAQVPVLDGVEARDPLAPLRYELERKRRRIALVAVVLITPGLALPFLGKRSRRHREVPSEVDPRPVTAPAPPAARPFATPGAACALPAR